VFYFFFVFFTISTNFNLKTIKFVERLHDFYLLNFISLLIIFIYFLINKFNVRFFMLSKLNNNIDFKSHSKFIQIYSVHCCLCHSFRYFCYYYLFIYFLYLFCLKWYIIFTRFPVYNFLWKKNSNKITYIEENRFHKICNLNLLQ